MNIKAITETCKHINWTRGAGDIIGDVQVASNGEARAVIKRFGLRTEERKVTILDGGARVRFLGTTRKVIA